MHAHASACAAGLKAVGGNKKRTYKYTLATKYVLLRVSWYSVVMMLGNVIK